MNIENISLSASEKLEDLHRNGLFIIQNRDFFCFGQDAVLLSHFAKIKKGEKILDLCTGNGVIPILLSAKSSASEIFGIEIFEENVQLARKSVKLNSLENLIKIDKGDIKNVLETYERGYFDVVTANPPYMKIGQGVTNRSEILAAARHEVLCDIRDVCECAAVCLKFGGRFYMVHLPERLTEVFEALTRSKLEPKRLRFVHAFHESEPAVFLAEAQSGAKSGLRVLPPLFIYKEKDVYTDEAYNIYYGG